MKALKRFFRAYWDKITPRHAFSLELNNRNKNILFIAFLALSIISVGMTIANIKEAKPFMIASSIFLIIIFLISALVIRFTKKYKILGVCLGILTICILFSYYFFNGGSGGISCIWLVILPFAAINCIDVRWGSYCSFYFGILIFLLCWTPLVEYTDHLLPFIVKRLPIWFSFSYLIGVITWYHTFTEERDNKELIKNLDAKINQAKNDNLELLMKAIVSISNIIDAKDTYTKEHSTRVAEYAKLLATELNWNKEDIEDVYTCGLIHDIGKVGIPLDILNKPGRLDDNEYEIIKKHPDIGYKIIKDLVNKNIADGIYSHHERIDGNGYPRKTTKISDFGKIIAIADAFDAMNSNRVYRKSLSESYIIEQLINNKGTQFDAKYVDIFLKLLNEGKISFNIKNIEDNNRRKKA